MIVLVCYDIANPGRLRRIAKVMEDFGKRVQRSIFEVSLSPKSFLAMTKRIKKEIEPDLDGVKLFPLCGECSKKNDIIGLGEYIDFSKTYIIL
ncbi:MAG: CRISPR-associated endonuclease Cas2 [Bdellovibrionota bacterium]